MPVLTKTATCLLRCGGSSNLWDRIVTDIENHRVLLFSVSNGSYLVLSIVEPATLFVHACAGNDAQMLMQICILTARHNRCDNVLFQTIKKGLPRLLKKFNPVEVSHNIYRVAL